MGEVSESVRLLKLKLSEIVCLAKQIPVCDRKAAVLLWFATFKQIQNIWNHYEQNQEVKAESRESLSIEEGSQEAVQKKRSMQKVRSTSKKTERDKISKCGEDRNADVSRVQDKLTDPKEYKATNNKIRLESDFIRYNTVEVNGPHVKQEQVEVDAEEINSIHRSEGNLNEEIMPQVQSVHLMISADPLLSTSDMKLKELEKTEVVHKINTPYQCEVCGKQVNSHAALQTHLKSHFEEKLYKCSECPASFKFKGGLWRHQASHSGEKPWSCDVCGKCYTEKSSLKVHYRTHTREKPFACSYCPKKFSQSGILQNHLLLHKNSLPHFCDVCGRSFRQRFHLITHMRRHQGIRPYACTECDSKFTTKGDYDRHLRTHTGERPHHCDVCGSSFTRFQTLQEHKNRHYNIKPYVCKVCGKSFYALSGCSRHVKSVHAVEGDAPNALENILRIGNSSSDKGDIVKNVHITQIINDDDMEGKLMEYGNDSRIVENSDIVNAVSNDEEEQCELLVVNDEREMSITDSTPEYEILNDACQNPPSKVICEGCGAVFSTLRDLHGHLRYKCSTAKKKGVKNLGVPITQWLRESETGYASQEEKNIKFLESNEPTIESTGEMTESIEFIQEVGDVDIGHAVSIDEDGSITTVPFSQITPIQIQLENDYMVVLSDNTKDQQEPATFAAHDMHQVETEEHSHATTEVENDDQRITLVLNP
ncbi:hypothetical protein SK128_010227 [Halocaridina rubra]|uniref:C2H2-type domain-containing protein n=1 Tax=Halocaridina rubra TaxID=373956 RepID=A0AAN8XKP7_HALRR